MLNIKDAETDRLARRLAQLTGESLTKAVRTAVRERLEREERQRGRPSVEHLMAIVRRYASRAVIDDRSADEIIGYDEGGCPADGSRHLRARGDLSARA
jgi:antitoxin VapB